MIENKNVGGEDGMWMEGWQVDKFVAAEPAELNACQCRVWLDKEDEKDGIKGSPEQSG